MKPIYIISFLVIALFQLTSSAIGTAIMYADTLNHSPVYLESEEGPIPDEPQELADNSPVPEPATMFLLGTGLLVLAAFKSRLTQQKKEKKHRS